MEEKNIFDLKRRLFRERHGEPKGPWEKFYEYLVVEQSTVLPAKPNWEALALFDMIQLTFDGSGLGRPVKVNPYLIHNLALCCGVALLYDKNQKVLWDSNEHNDILKRTYQGFANTIIMSIQNGTAIEDDDGKIFVGGLHIPKWFAYWAKGQAAKQDPQ